MFHVNIGVESISQDSLLSMNKIQNHAKEYKKLLKRMEHYGIYYSLNFLFGLEEDYPEIFDEALEFLREVKAPEAFFNTVTPRKGTPMRTGECRRGASSSLTRTFTPTTSAACSCPTSYRRSRSKKACGAAPRSSTRSSRCSSGC